MIRTQVYLTPQIHKDIQSVAAREKKPAAQVIRELLADSLKRKDQMTIGEALQQIVDLGKRLKTKGPKDLSTNIDKYLYEDD